MADPSTGEERIDALIGEDPYIPWIMGPGAPFYFLPGRQPQGQERVPLLVRLKKGTAQEFAEGAHLPEFARSEWQNSVSVSPLFTQSIAGSYAAPYLVAIVAASYLREMSAEVRRRTAGIVESVTPGLPLDSTALPPPDEKPTQAPPPQILPATQGTVVMAVIDDGIAFANERFRKIVAGKVKTRVEYWWLQDGPYIGPTSTVSHGYELRRPDINKLLAACTVDGAIDEGLLYRKATLLDFRQQGHKSVAWHAAHGTAVMDLACGYDPDPPVEDRPIIAVQLPVRVTADTSGGSLYPWVVMAIAYILDRVAVLSGGPQAPQLPVVITLSYGRLEGPHDGTSDIERAFEQFIQQSSGKVRIVLPAGNSFLLRTHAQVEFRQANQCKSLRWRVLPDGFTPSFAEIWLPLREPDAPLNRLEVTITSPTGDRHTISETSGPVRWGVPGRVYAEAHYSIAQPSGRGMFRISVAPTTYLDDPTLTLSPPGTWCIELKNVNDGLTGHVVHAWVQRDDTLYGFPVRGRQSFFDDPCYVRFDQPGYDKETDDPDSLVKRAGTINSMATGESTIVAGGYLRKEMAMASYSSAGVLVGPSRFPDAAAVSEDSRIYSGIFAAGSYSGSVVAMNGTSVAAPQVARLVASDLAAGGNGDRLFVDARAAIDEGSYPAATTPPRPPAERGGTGRLKPFGPQKRYDWP